MRFFTALLAAALLASPALAADQVEALRARAASARAEVSSLKRRQLATRNELSQVSAQVEALKAKSSGALLTGGELDAALKQSQSLSGALTDLAQTLSQKEPAAESANLALVEALSTQLVTLRAEFDRQPDRGIRRQVLDRMKRTRAERDAVRASLPESKLPTLDTVRPSEDPEELLGQADLLRDNEEKLRHKLKAVERRLAERQEEVELDRRVRRFVDEESMFDDQDRRLRVQRTTITTMQGREADSFSAANPTAPPPNVGAANTETFDTAGAYQPASLGSPSDSRSSNETTNFFGAAPQAAPGGAAEKSSGTHLDSSSIRITTTTDARPTVGAPRGVATGDDDDIDDLIVERNRLSGLAAQLKAKAAELEKKAAQLK